MRNKLIKRYAVIDDYGDEALTDYIAYETSSLKDAEEWAEENNFHSASIVSIINGKREKL